MSAGGDGGTKQRFELYIKASAIDKETKGSCPICQHWFMITCLLGENQDDIDFKVYTVQADCPPKNFGVDQGWSKKFPVVMVLEGRDKRGQDLTGTKYDTFEELETFFESINKDCPELKRKNAPNVAAMQAVEDVYNAFNTSLNMGKPNKRLSSALKKINDFLESDDECKFLVDNVLSFADCYLLPRLQHIRVAGKEYLDFDIPSEYMAIWKYLADAYQTEAFRSTMPSNQDVVFHYEKKASNWMQRQKRRPRPTLQNFTFTLEVPEDIALMLQGLAASANGDESLPPPPADVMAAVDIAPQPQEDEVPASQEEVTAAQEEVTADQEEVNVSQGEVTAAQEEVTAAQEEVTVTQEEVTVTQEEAVVSAEVAADQDGGVADDGVAVGQDTTAVDVSTTEEVAYKAPTVVETPDIVITADEAIVTQALPPPDEEDVVVAADGVAADEGLREDGTDVAQVPGGGDNDEGVVAADTDTVGGGEAVTEVRSEDAVGVKIIVGTVEDVIVQKDVGNGDVIKEKGEEKDDFTKADAPVASVDGSAE